MNIEEENLDNFGGWAGDATEEDFFNQPDIEDEVESGTGDTKPVEGEVKTSEKTEVKEVEASAEQDLFNEKEVESAEEEEEDDESENSANQSVLTLQRLKERGFIDYELEEGQELTEELADELLEEKFDESVETKVAELMSSLPEDKQQVIEYLIKGGNLSQFISTLSSGNTSIDLEIDLESEDNQISTLKKLLSLEDKDAEEIETEIEFLKDSGKLKLMTEKKFNKYKAEQNTKQKELVKAQALAVEEEKQQLKQAKAKINEFLSKNEAVNGINFTKEDKKDLPSYMNDKTIKLQSGATITKMQKELFYDLPKNETALIQLATLLRNRNEDGTFNFESIAKSVNTKVAQEVRKNVRREKSSIPGSSTNKVNKSDKTLADYFTRKN